MFASSLPENCEACTLLILAASMLNACTTPPSSRIGRSSIFGMHNSPIVGSGLGCAIASSFSSDSFFGLGGGVDSGVDDDAPATSPSYLTAKVSISSFFNRANCLPCL